ncbi:MAG: flagellin [bacterium]|nr:flagellin [bacterium]
MIISENLRAQVAGLSQAIKNSENGVNLIKTAEASLDEVLKQLRSIRTLALDALNTGAGDAVGRRADQTQITSSIATLTRIASNTQFGTKKLLDGTSGVSGTSSDESILTFVSASSLTQTGTFAVAGITAATQGSKSLTINNEFQTAVTGGTAAVDLGSNKFVAFQVDFGVGLTATDAKTLGTDLTDAGLKDDTSVTGVTVRFNEQDATAYVVIDQTTGGFTTAGLDNPLLTALNGTTLGKFVTFNEDNPAGDQLVVGSKFAGLALSVTDISQGTGQVAGTSAASVAVDATADQNITNNFNVTFTVDFGNGLDATGKKALGQALADAGAKNGTANQAANANFTLNSVTFDKDTAVFTVKIHKIVAGGVEADIAAALNASDSNLGDFVVFGNNATAFVSAKSQINVKITNTAASNGAETIGFNGAEVIAGVALAAAEVDDLGDALAYSASLAPTTQVKQGASAVKLLRETLTFNAATVVTIASGTLLSNLAGVLNQQLDTAGVGVGATFTADTDLAVTKGSTLKLTNDAFGNNSATGGKNTVSSNRELTLGFHLTVGTAAVTVEGTNVAGTINTIAATGVGQTLTLASAGNSADGLAVKFTGTVDPTGLTITVNQGSLVFQVGANAGQTVTQKLPDVRAAQLGKTATGLEQPLVNANVSQIDVTTEKGARDGLKLIDAAIDQVTTARGELGAFQANVLESTISSLGVARENLAAAESAIRDADFADETVQFTRNQILLQAGTAILTQANAIPQAVLQLLA